MTSVPTDRREAPQYDEYLAAKNYPFDEVISPETRKFDRDSQSSYTSMLTPRRKLGVAVALVAAGITAVPLDSTNAPEASDRDSELLQTGVNFDQWIASPPTNVPASESWPSTARGIVQSLGRLNDGWLGDGSVCPSEKCLATILMMGSVLPSVTCVPDCEVDEDTGNVTLRWISHEEGASFALIIMQDGTVVSVLATQEKTYPTSQFSATELSKIARLVDSSMVSKLISA